MHTSSIQTVQRAFDACTWGNTRETAEDWLSQLDGTDQDAKKRLFARVFLESSDTTIIKALFTQEQIASFLADFDKPLARAHQERRRKVWRFLYLGERSPIPELDWTMGP